MESLRNPGSLRVLLALFSACCLLRLLSPSSAHDGALAALAAESDAAPRAHPSVEYVTQCHQQGWWSLFLAPSEHIKPLLPDGFRLADNASALSWPVSYHPVLLETQVQSNCTEKSIPFVHTNFHEFKLEIPYVLRRESTDNQQLFMYKPLLYANTWTDVLGAATVYGLNIKHASSMPTNDSFFGIDYEGEEFQMSFANFTDWLPANTAMTQDHLDVFVNMTTIPWLCKGTASCAYNAYDWATARVRPSSASASFGQGVLPNLGMDSVKFRPIGTSPYGSVQLDAILHITGVMDCPY